MKLWDGRFENPSSKNAEEYNDSLSFDKKLWTIDLTASLAHANMLDECGIIPHEDFLKICDGLYDIFSDIDSGKLVIEGAEDIHSFVEGELVKRIGDVGKKLHTARSRNDQVATDFRIYVRTACDILVDSLKNLIGSLLVRAEDGLNAIIPGYTHLRKAQPMCAGHFFNAYSEMFLRDIERVRQTRERLNYMPLGSGALAGTSFPIDRNICAELLEFTAPTSNSLDAVSDRDFVAEYLFDASLIAAHLSRLCEDIILYSAEEFGYFEIADEYSTGSSIMPQKKNPDIPELMRGKTGRIYGHLIAILTTIKAIPLAYDKDLQEDKEGLFDADKQIVMSVDIMCDLLQNITLKKDKMRAAADKDFCCATDVADYLTKKGKPFREAHEVTGKIVRFCIDKNRTLQNLTADEYRTFDKLFGDEIVNVVKAENCANSRNSFGGASRLSVAENIQSIKSRLQKL